MHKSAERLYQAAGNPAGPTELSRLMSTTAQAVKNWEARGVSKDAALAAEEFFGCSPLWILKGLGRAPDGSQVPKTPQQPDLKAALVAIRNQLAHGQGHDLVAAAEALRLLAQVPDSERAFDAALQRLEALALARIAGAAERPLGATIAPEHDERLRQMADLAEELHAKGNAGGGQQRRRTSG